MYNFYQYHRQRPKRRPHFFVLIIIVLIVVIAAGICALFIRGFRVKDLTPAAHSTVTIPEMKVWLIQANSYTEKMAAYKDSVMGTQAGFGTYIYSQETQWVWVCSVYLDEATVNAAMENPHLPEAAQVVSKEITKKQFKFDHQTAAICQQILTIIQNNASLLDNLRTAVIANKPTQELVLSLTNNYNLIKDAMTTLQTANQQLHEPFLAALIYAGNQNLLSLHNLIFDNYTGNKYLAAINTALINCIFSLDNF